MCASKTLSIIGRGKKLLERKIGEKKKAKYTGP